MKSLKPSEKSEGFCFWGYNRANGFNGLPLNTQAEVMVGNINQIDNLKESEKAEALITSFEKLPPPQGVTEVNHALNQATGMAAALDQIGLPSAEKAQTLVEAVAKLDNLTPAQKEAFVQRTVPTMKLEPVDKGYIMAQTIHANRDLNREEQQKRLAESFKELKLSEPEQQEIMKRVATTTLKE